MGAKSRRKGNVGELEWVHLLRGQGFSTAERDLSQTRDGGGDIVLPPFLYEVKRYHKIAVRKWLDEAQASVVNYKGVEIPVVAMREDGRKDWMVLLRAEDFLNLLKIVT